MEQQNQDAPLFDLRVDENTKEQLLGLSKWTMIVAITAIIGLVLSLIEALMPKKSLDYGSMRFETEKSSGIGSVIIGIIVSGILAYLLYQFSVLTKRGIDNLNQGDLNKGLGSLKSYFKVYGIIIIIVMSIALLVLVVGGTIGFTK